MNIEQINTVLTKAIVGLQESEIEAITEVAYKPPSPSKFGFKVGSKDDEFREKIRKLSPGEREDFIQMYLDNIETMKAKREPIPKQWIQRLGILRSGGKKSKVDWIYPDQVFGHPQATNLAGYKNLIPLKAKSGDTAAIDRRISNVQKKIDKLQKEIGMVHAKAQGRVKVTPAQKKKAQQTLKSANFDTKETILGMLRDETMKELNRLYREVKG